MTTMKPRPTSRVCAGRTGFPESGAEGIRTPDLLIANETRYQLRHSPFVQQDSNTTAAGHENQAGTTSPILWTAPQTQLGNHIRRCHSSSGMTSAT